MTFQVIFSDEVKKRIAKVPRNYQQKIFYKLKALSDFPHFLDVKKVKGLQNTFRLRVGNYRIAFEVNYKDKIISVKSFAPRGRIEYR